jgi:Na+/H+-dicarboxylate symporter
VFGLIAKAVASTGFTLFKAVGWYMVTIASGLTIHIFIVLPIVFYLFTKINPMKHYKAIASAMATAFSTSSSGATLPVTMDCIENRAGVSNKVTSFVLPLGATINMDGTALYECAGVLFISQALGFDLTVAQQLLIVITAFLASVGAAAIPSAGLVMIFIVLDAVGLGDHPQAAIIVGTMLAVDRPLDMFRTVVNVTSDTMGAVIVAKSEGEEVLTKV